jgi:uncharacterized FlaG/YvyC family protein
MFSMFLEKDGHLWLPKYKTQLQQVLAQPVVIGFSVDNALETPVVTVRSTVTGEVVRQIPNEAAVRMAHNIESIKGLLINANV